MKIKKIECYIKYFRKNKSLFTIALLQFLAVIICVAVFSACHLTGFRLLYLLSRWNFYFSAVLAVMMFLSLSVAANANCAETIDVISKNKFSWQKGISYVWLIILSGYHFAALAGLVYCSLANDGSHYFLFYLPKPYLINILIPQLILIGIAYVASCISEKNKIFAGSVLVAALMFTSPLFERLIWREKPDGFPIDLIAGRIRWIFSIFYQNAVWAPDTLYGLQTEDNRLYLQLFWMMLIIAFLLWFYCKENKLKKKVSCICILAAFVLAGFSYLPASFYRQDESWNGIFADLSYYDGDKTIHPHMNGVDYKIREYNMDIQFKRNLKVKGEFKLESRKPDDQFVLTLYHGYDVGNIRSEDTELTYERSGDKIILNFPEKITQCTFEIEYEGMSGKYYSNSQAVMLPGYFPWYPMAGERQVFAEYPYYNGGNGYNPYNRIPEADFSLRISSGCDFVTNIKKKEENLYEGRSDGISIVGGNIVQTENSCFLNYLPLELSRIGEKQYLEELNQNWQQILAEIENVFGIDSDELRNKKLIMASKDMGRNFSNNFFVEFDDYILFSENYLSSAFYITYLLHQSGKESEIGDQFISAVLSADTVSADEILEDMFSRETEYQQFFNEMGEKDSSPAISDRLKELKQQLGAETLLRHMIQYLLDPELKTDQDFFDKYS